MTKGRLLSRLRTAGLLTAAVGFLTLPCRAVPLDDMLNDLAKTEAQRDRLLARADSLGTMLASLPSDAGKQAKAVLRQAEDLGRQSRDLDLEILLAKDRCRTLALQELDQIRARIAAGREGAMSGALAARARVLTNLFEGRLSERWGAGRVMVEPDSSDGYETLLDKRAYLEDLQDEILEMDQTLGRRIDRARRERSLREASAEFREEARFLDESGRVGSDDRVILRGLGGPADYETEDGDAGRIVVGRESNLGTEENGTVVPPGLDRPAGVDRLAALQRTRERLARELNLVVSALRDTQTLLGRYPPTGP